jgi:hypothetical protein
MAALLPQVARVCRLPVLVSVLAGPLAVSPVFGQVLRDEPVRLFDRRVTITADVSATGGARDDEAFFNYTDYERNALRTFQAGLTALWQPLARLSALAEVRTDDFARLELRAAYIRVRPFREAPLDIQMGRIPPVFGAFGRRAYESDRILIGYPLAYQYLTSLRADALPASAQDLIVMRGRGWQSSFPIGSTYAGPGLPLVSAFRWDTGVQAYWAAGMFEAAAALTQGTLSNPRVDDDNGGKQLAGRIAVQPSAAVKVGGSIARGAWIADTVPLQTSSAAQTVVGADVEWSAGRWLVRGETIWSRWNVPFVSRPAEGSDLRALGTWIEGRYRLTPRVYLASRIDRLAFSTVGDPVTSVAPQTWDANVSRIEGGLGLLLHRNLVWRTVVQHNRRAGGRVRERTFVSSQLSWWF